MKNLLVFSLIYCAIFVYGLEPVQHNLFYGSCAHDNDTVPIYTQVIVMDNPGGAHAPKPTRWFDWFKNLSFRKKHAENGAAAGAAGHIINTTVVFPPVVSC